MKKVCLSLLMGLMVQMTFGQTLEKMQWFNEPEQWEIISIPALDEEGRSFWEERYPAKELKQIQRNKNY